MADYKFYALFTANKVGKTGITVTIDVYKSADDSLVVNNAAVNEIAGGLYSYVYQTTSADDYVAIFKTADTSVDQQHVPALATKETINAAQTGEYTTALTAIQADLDNPAQYKADVSGLALETTAQAIKAKTDGIVTPPTTTQIADAVWTRSARTVTNTIPTAATIASTVWSNATRTLTTIRGNDWVIEIPGLTLDGKIQFAIKRSDNEPDERSVLFIDSVSGLLTVNGKPAADPIHAELDYTVDILSIVVDACITAQLAKGTYIYGIQSVNASGDVLERYGGQFVVLGDVVRATE